MIRTGHHDQLTDHRGTWDVLDIVVVVSASIAASCIVAAMLAVVLR